MKITEHKKKNGAIVYRSNVYLGVDSVTGKKVRTTITARTKKEVKQKARIAVVNFEKNGHTVKKKAAVKTYAELAELWWDSYKHTVKPNSQIKIRGLLNNYLIPAFGSYRLDKLTRPIIQTTVNTWANKVNRGEKGAFKEYHTLISFNKRILRFGISLQVIDSNPANDIIVPRQRTDATKQKIQYFTDCHLKQFLTYIDQLGNDFQAIYDRTLYHTLLATGCRINELLALEWADIDF